MAVCVYTLTHTLLRSIDSVGMSTVTRVRNYSRAGISNWTQLLKICKFVDRKIIHLSCVHTGKCEPALGEAN